MNFPLSKFRNTTTPFYYYDVDLFERTAKTALTQANKYGYIVHYALKANANERLLRILSGMGFGADCVSGAEVQRAAACGFDPKSIAFAGVGKRDDEINLGIDHGIFTFNCESEQELEVINELAKAKGKVATVALRINPNVDAHTHAHITTGLAENKFGINLWQLDEVAKKVQRLSNIKLISIHFHIGSQITELEPFVELCRKVNELQDQLEKIGVAVEHVNLGGGLSVDYHHPDEKSIPDFAGYFAAINKTIKLRAGQKLHVELGRSIAAQCGSLVTKCLFIKELLKKNFVVVDAGFSDLIRPALYGAYHKIENLTSPSTESKKYDVVGPICESSDTFDKDVSLPTTQRGDYLVLRTAGAYGEVMASQYNLRSLPKAVFSTDLK
ncbi:MAG: diaminopimelate decarboxylase [Prevotellaceae bacterium]|jgi:diaminopimelate decarboxylase|nr:diaminopimelate decarboxylase [Prevotellaceae bacterium]